MRNISNEIRDSVAGLLVVVIITVGYFLLAAKRLVSRNVFTY